MILRRGSAGATADLMAKLGVWAYLVAGFRRKVVRDQIAGAFPGLGEDDREMLARRVFSHLGRMVAEVFGRGPDDPLPEIEIQPGWEALDRAVAAGQGVIVATAHLGNFEFGGAVLAARYPLLDVVKPQRNTGFDDFVNALRARRGILTVAMDQSGPLVVRHLRRGGLVSLLLDQDAGGQGVFVDFMGRPASTWPGAARLSIRTGCPVVPMALVRVGAHRHRLVIRPPLWPRGRADDAAQVGEYLQEISRSVEALIREFPEQWFWVHRRWKSVPPPRRERVP